MIRAATCRAALVRFRCGPILLGSGCRAGTALAGHRAHSGPLSTPPACLRWRGGPLRCLARVSPHGDAESDQNGGEDKDGGRAKDEKKEDFQQDRGVSLWLFGCAGIVFTIVLVGGATRLTRSGLSMTDWKPLGEKRPETEEEWEAEFERYKQFPEYQKLNQGMTLAEFKFIYHMEYSHRMLGRAAGLVFGLPFLYLAARGRIRGALARRLGVLLAMGAAQGGIGWWMVKSGLKHREDDPYWTPRVSPYRLTTHLLSAFAIYTMLVDTALKAWPAAPDSLLARSASAAPPGLRALLVGTLHLLAITYASGALVAGNQAGLVYNEWPMMGTGLVPTDLVDPYLKPAWRNLFENSTTVQFDHRMLAYLTAGAVGLTWRQVTRQRMLPPNARLFAHAMGALTATQVGLGITALLTMVPVSVGVMHQGGALLTLTSGIFLLHALGRKSVRLPPAAVKSGALALGLGAVFPAETGAPREQVGSVCGRAPNLVSERALSVFARSTAPRMRQ